MEVDASRGAEVLVVLGEEEGRVRTWSARGEMGAVGEKVEGEGFDGEGMVVRLR